MALPAALAPFWACQAHMMSLSTGDLRVEGKRMTYELRLPSFEVAHLTQPESQLLNSFRFRSRGEQGRLAEHGCRLRVEENAYVCTAVYEFDQPVEVIEAECQLTRVTVPNHVHVLRAAMGDKTDQAVFDFSLTRADLRFQPPTALEQAVQQTAGGIGRALGGMAQLLFLTAVVVAARSRKELASMFVAFQMGKILAIWAVPLTGWQPNPRFVEAAAALTVAYLAVESLMLPEAGMRWLVVGVMGLFHGLSFLLYLNQAAYPPVFVMAGAAAAELTALACLRPCWTRVVRNLPALRPAKSASAILLLYGLAWFGLRLHG
jgi:hypothetical protein